MAARIQKKDHDFCAVNREARALLTDAASKLNPLELTINPDWIPPLDRAFKLY